MTPKIQANYLQTRLFVTQQLSSAYAHVHVRPDQPLTLGQARTWAEKLERYARRLGMDEAKLYEEWLSLAFPCLSKEDYYIHVPEGDADHHSKPAQEPVPIRVLRIPDLLNPIELAGGGLISITNLQEQSGQSKHDEQDGQSERSKHDEQSKPDQLDSYNPHNTHTPHPGRPRYYTLYAQTAILLRFSCTTREEVDRLTSLIRGWRGRLRGKQTGTIDRPGNGPDERGRMDGSSRPPQPRPGPRPRGSLGMGNKNKNATVIRKRLKKYGKIPLGSTDQVPRARSSDQPAVSTNRAGLGDGSDLNPRPSDIHSSTRIGLPVEFQSNPQAVERPQECLRSRSSSRSYENTFRHPFLTRNDRPYVFHGLEGDEVSEIDSVESGGSDRDCIEGMEEMQVEQMQGMAIDQDVHGRAGFMEKMDIDQHDQHEQTNKGKERKGKRPAGVPPVWSVTRQELCETLPYYRAYQSGLYMLKGTAFGYLLDGFGSVRDVWEAQGRVVVSHGGGKCIQYNPENGPSFPVLKEDQNPLTDARVATLLNARDRRTPIVLIAGKGYEAGGFDLGQAGYVVLGWYWISITWVEPEPVPPGIECPEGRGYFHRYKIRFDWVDTQGQPWWLPSDCAGKEWEPGDPFLGSKPVGPDREKTESGTCKPGVDTRRRTIPGQGRIRAPSGVTLLGTIRSTSSSNSPATIDSLAGPPNDLETKALGAEAVPPVSSGPEVIIKVTPTPKLEPRLGDTGYHSAFLCDTCSTRSPWVYLEWLCLNPGCSSFWRYKTDSGSTFVPLDARLKYRPGFLSVRMTPPHLSVLPFDLFAHDDPSTRDGVDGETSRGFVCPTCHRANCREQLDSWVCLTCGFTRSARKGVLQIPIDRSSQDVGFAHSTVGVMQVTSKVSSAGQSWIYHLGFGGLVIHLKTPSLGTMQANDILRAYLDTPGFARHPVHTHVVATRMLAQHYTRNDGEEYKYMERVASTALLESPLAIKMAFWALQEATENSVAREFEPFNEILSVFYLDDQKMNYHDDGEHGVGDVIASLSLGAPAMMHWRLKADKAALRKRETNNKSRKAIYNEPSLSIRLDHGDVMIMVGAEMQTKYEHCVVPTGPRIAVTCRSINKVEHDAAH